ncbi:MAG: hypothetical protein ABSB88_10330 [Bryobacteraceae bacterium]|jgi:hypothetical protein
MKIRYGCILAAALVWTGCGRAERKEAVTFCKVLTQKHADFAATNALEKDLLGSTRSWCESIIAAGSGHGKDLSGNADSAKELAQSASLVSRQLGHLRQSLYDQPLRKENVQAIRAKLLSQIQKRQTMLQDVRVALEGAAANFLEFEQSRAYTGDTYPAGIDKLNSMLGGYTGAEDLLGKAIAELKATYKIQEADLSSGGPAT